LRPRCSRPHGSFCDQYLLNGWLTIINSSEDPVKDPSNVALAALAWVLSDTPRAERFLALTGLSPEALRAGIGDPATHRAVLEFLCAHEPDLVAAAESLGLEPVRLAAVREQLA
jgi:hypothetical protein